MKAYAGYSERIKNHGPGLVHISVGRILKGLVYVEVFNPCF